MTIIHDLLNQIGATLGSGIFPNLSTASDTSDIFEAYVFSCVLEAARVERASITFSDVNGNNNPPIFIFRTSPGYIYSTTHAYTHAIITFTGSPPLEAHVGVRVGGASRVLHECDVAVFEQAEAETCRRNRVAPRSSKMLLAVECKFYSTPLQLHLAREFIGLTSDLSSKSESIFVTNSYSDSIERLLSARKKTWEDNIKPSAINQVERLRNKFRNAFQVYKAKYV